MSDKPNDLARALRRFLSEHMPLTRGLSPHTVRSYRDAFVLLLRFLATRHRREVVDLDITDLDPASVMAFLDDLEAGRANCAATRNVRLAAIHAFARFVAAEHPEYLELCQRLLAVPFKRAHAHAVEYLEADEIHAILAAPDRTTADGRRDHVLLLTLFSTGARVQELLHIRPRDLQLVPPPHVRLVGKGHKERLSCPLLPRTADALKRFLAEIGADRSSSEPLFRNRRGAPLTLPRTATVCIVVETTRHPRIPNTNMDLQATESYKTIARDIYPLPPPLYAISLSALPAPTPHSMNRQCHPL